MFPRSSGGVRYRSPPSCRRQYPLSMAWLHPGGWWSSSTDGAGYSPPQRSLTGGGSCRSAAPVAADGTSHRRGCHWATRTDDGLGTTSLARAPYCCVNVAAAAAVVAGDLSANAGHLNWGLHWHAFPKIPLTPLIGPGIKIQWRIELLGLSQWSTKSHIIYNRIKPLTDIPNSRLYIFIRAPLPRFLLQIPLLW